MRWITIALVALLLSACVPSRQTHAIDHRRTMLHGSDDALFDGCVRGVIRWHHATTGQWVALDDVAVMCDEVQRSFDDELPTKLSRS